MIYSFAESYSIDHNPIESYPLKNGDVESLIDSYIPKENNHFHIDHKNPKKSTASTY